MSDTTTSIEDIANAAYRWFERASRDDSDQFTRLKNDAPEWVKDLVRAAHDSYLPDDWRYDAISDACQAIADGEDDESSWADSYVDVYTNALYAWLASNLRRGGYVDEAVEELGWPSDGGIAAAIAMGQHMEAREVFGLVREKLEERSGELGES